MLIDPPMDHVTRPTYASKVKIQPSPGTKRNEPWKNIRQHTATRQSDTPKERIAWASQKAPNLAAIKYPKGSVDPFKLLELIKENLPVHSWECLVPGVIYIRFATEEAFIKATTEPVLALPAGLQPLPVRYSVKKRIEIRAHHVPLSCSEENIIDLRNHLQALFGLAGDIVDLQRHCLMG
ncbi:hypothetical protein BGW42_008686, partial [Actinomortierella wolfii]